MQNGLSPINSGDSDYQKAPQKPKIFVYWLFGFGCGIGMGIIVSSALWLMITNNLCSLNLL